MGIVVYFLLWVLQDLYHRPYLMPLVLLMFMHQISVVEVSSSQPFLALLSLSCTVGATPNPATLA